MRPAALAATLSGRADEQAALLEVVRAGLDGSPRAVLVHGEAGIGKTTLVRSVCEQVQGEGAQVLWGQSLRFGTVEAMYHPLVLALEGWLAEADDSERASVLEAVPGAALILPSLGAVPAAGPSTLLTVVDALLGRVVARGPTVLVVDDVQWADPATWDALTYLVAGFGRQRLALVTTHRDEAVVGDAFQRWLANIRRLPATQELSLARLGQAATEDQIAVLLGTEPSPRLVEQVQKRSRGNPYFSELLVRRGDLGDSELPDDLPDELSQALLDAWRGLSAPAREAARILAVGGRPIALSTLTTISAALGVPTVGTLREAVDAGVMVLDGDRAWFRHPLLAVVLAESYLPGEAAPVHSVWANYLAGISSEGVDELRRLGDLATHLEHAGDYPEAFQALLRAAELAEELGARREAARLLVRAAKMWPESPAPADATGHARLLERAGRACQWVGWAREASELLTAARDLVDADRDPLWMSALTARLARLSALCGEATEVYMTELARAVELSRAQPDSREHAGALIAYSEEIFWDRGPDHARQTVEDAVAAARRSGSSAALSGALGVRAYVLAGTDIRQADQDSRAGWEQALASGEREVVGEALIVRANLADTQGDLPAHRKKARDLHDFSVPQGPRVFPSVLLADVLLATGELVDADAVIRTGLAAAGAPYAEANIRVLAALLATRRGLGAVAGDHLARAHEIWPNHDERSGSLDGPRLVELLLAAEDPAGALEHLERGLPLLDQNPRSMDELTLLAARATADLVQRAADERDQDAVRRHRDTLARLVAARKDRPGTPFARSGDADTVQPAREALFAAELDRAQGGTDQVRLWRAAVNACSAASMGWEQHVSSWRLALALIESGASGTEAAELLRDVHVYASQQGAAPLQARVEELAASAHISLATPRLPSSQVVPAAFTALTARESEVLAHLVANRTNAEIAQTLFISEKTVSVHVSNLLRKTSTGSRREVAALARRVGWAPTVRET
jgi:DNA-binding CsgD family transcriptional regulator/tetratricopeptide (TPR) repeat protein